LPIRRGGFSREAQFKDEESSKADERTQRGIERPKTAHHRDRVGRKRPGLEGSTQHINALFAVWETVCLALTGGRACHIVKSQKRGVWSWRVEETEFLAEGKRNHNFFG